MMRLSAAPCISLENEMKGTAALLVYASGKHRVVEGSFKHGTW